MICSPVYLPTSCVVGTILLHTRHVRYGQCGMPSYAFTTVSYWQAEQVAQVHMTSHHVPWLRAGDITYIPVLPGQLQWSLPLLVFMPHVTMKFHQSFGYVKMTFPE